MSKNHPHLLYQNSPFLPIISNDDINEIKSTVTSTKCTLLSAITQQAGYLGEALNILHEHELPWMIKSFGCTAQDINLFYLGFTTPLILILSAIKMDYAPIKVVIENLSLPTKLKFIPEHNKYKINLLHDFYYIISNKPTDKTESVLNLISSLLKQKPFLDNHYYNSGVEASIDTMKKLFKNYQNQNSATST